MNAGALIDVTHVHLRMNTGTFWINLEKLPCAMNSRFGQGNSYHPCCEQPFNKKLIIIAAVLRKCVPWSWKKLQPS